MLIKFPFSTGTRKADNVQVAVKQVPKAKVRRWGKLDGRIVPIEFELLHRAAESGNKGNVDSTFVCVDRFQSSLRIF